MEPVIVPVTVKSRNMRKGISFNIYPVPFPLILSRYRSTGMRTEMFHKKGRGVVTVDMEPLRVQAGRQW